MPRLTESKKKAKAGQAIVGRAQRHGSASDLAEGGKTVILKYKKPMAKTIG